jgi:hypothetical protein
LSFSLTSLSLVLSVSLLKPKCCCEGREPLKSERPRPSRAGAEGGESRRQLALVASTLDTPRRGSRNPRPQRSLFFWSPFSHLGNQTIRLGQRQQRLGRCRASGALSGQWWSGPLRPWAHPRWNVSISAEQLPALTLPLSLSISIS